MLSGRLVLSLAWLLFAGCGAEGSITDGESDGAVDAAIVVDTEPRVDSGTAAETNQTDTLDGADAAAEAADAAASPHVCPTETAPRDCSMGSGTGEADQCRSPPCCYLGMVQRVIGDLVSTRPEWFDFSGPSGCPIVKDVGVFLDTVVSTIVAKGYCAVRDPNAPDEEITVKKDNAFAESFDIVASTGCARWGPLICTGYCAPSWW